WPSVDPLRPALPLAITQDEFLDLARRGLWQVAEFDGSRALEVREVLATELDDLGLRRLHARLERDERLGPLAPPFVWNRDHRALHHRRVARHGLLHFDSGDVLAAGDDDVLLAIAQLDVAVGMPHRDVAGVEPSAAKRLGGGVGLLEVALHHVVAAHDDLSERLGVHRHILHVLVDHPYEIEDHVALALARGLPGHLVGRQAIPLRVPGAHRVRAVRLGEPVDVHRPEAQLLELREERRRWRRAGDGARDGMRERVGLGIVDDADLYGGRAAVVRHAFAVDQLPDAARLHAAQAHVGSTHRRHAPREA